MTAAARTSVARAVGINTPAVDSYLLRYTSTTCKRFISCSWRHIFYTWTRGSLLAVLSVFFVGEGRRLMLQISQLMVESHAPTCARGLGDWVGDVNTHSPTHPSFALQLVILRCHISVIFITDCLAELLKRRYLSPTYFMLISPRNSVITVLL